MEGRSGGIGSLRPEEEGCLTSQTPFGMTVFVMAPKRSWHKGQRDMCREAGTHQDPVIVQTRALQRAGAAGGQDFLGMARWERLYHEWVALDFDRRLYWPGLVSTGSTHRNFGPG
jgi:hypothetical protein